MSRSAAALARRLWSDAPGPVGTLLSLALVPAEVAYRAANAARNRAYDRGVLATHAVDIPVISIGNIAVGGSGKTPFTNWLARRAAQRSARPAIVHGGYAADEPALHRAWTPDIPVVVDRDRVRAARSAQRAGATVVILDDAFQHRRIRRDLDIVLVAVERWPRSVRLLPRGPWREPAAALGRAHLIVCVRRTASEREAAALGAALGSEAGRPVARVYLRPCAWRRSGRPSPAPSDPALAVAGVADPRLFEVNAAEAGAAVSAMLTFPDHHAYSAKDAARIVAAAAGRPVVTSAKDWTKLAALLDPERTWVLEQEVIVEAGGDRIDRELDRVLA